MRFSQIFLPLFDFFLRVLLDLLGLVVVVVQRPDVLMGRLGERVVVGPHLLFEFFLLLLNSRRDLLRVEGLVGKRHPISMLLAEDEVVSPQAVELLLGQGGFYVGVLRVVDIEGGSVESFFIGRVLVSEIEMGRLEVLFVDFYRFFVGLLLILHSLH